MRIIIKMLIIIVLITNSTLIFCQNISLNEVKIKHSKEVKKAQKKGNMLDAGFYWNKDKSVLNKFYFFYDDKKDENKIEVFTFTQQGSLKETQILPFSQETLDKFSLVDFEKVKENKKREIERFKAAFVRNPVLAGSPTLVYGGFEKENNSLGVFKRFKFKKGDTKKLGDKFWSFVYYPYGESALSRANHLIQPTSALGKAVFIHRNDYMPVNSKAYVSGLMAVQGSKKLISGVLDVASATFDSKSEIDLPDAIIPGNFDYVKLDNNETGMLIPVGKEDYYYLEVDNTGKKKHLIKLGIPKSGGKHNKRPTALIEKNDNDVFVLGATYKGLSGKKIGLGISKINKGKELWSKIITNDELTEKAVFSKKHKVKVDKLAFMDLKSFQVTENGDFLVLAKAKKNIEDVTLIMNLSSKGELKACYAIEPINPPKDEKLTTNLPTQLVPTQNGFYAISRANIKGYEKGVKMDSQTYRAGYFNITETHSYRIDDTFSAANIAKINLKDKTISNVLQIKGFVVGDYPGKVSKDGSLIITSDSGKVIFIK